jgi:endoglucanase Acf2
MNVSAVLRARQKFRACCTFTLSKAVTQKKISAENFLGAAPAAGWNQKMGVRYTKRKEGGQKCVKRKSKSQHTRSSNSKSHTVTHEVASNIDSNQMYSSRCSENHIMMANRDGNPPANVRRRRKPKETNKLTTGRGLERSKDKQSAERCPIAHP